MFDECVTEDEGEPGEGGGNCRFITYFTLLDMPRRTKKAL